MKVEGGKARLSFTNLGGGLTSKPGPTLIPRAEVPRDTPLVESELKRFEIAGEDRAFDCGFDELNFVSVFAQGLGTRGGGRADFCGAGFVQLRAVQAPGEQGRRK